MSELKEILLGFGVWSVIIFVCFLINQNNKKIELQYQKKTDEEKQEIKKKNEEFEETIGKLFLICMFLGGGFYLFKTMDEKLDIRLDFERKSYIPYSINNETFLINKYNGKTYKLERKEINNTYFYKYEYLAKPKSKHQRIFDKKDPLNLAF